MFELYDAVRDGDVARVKTLLREGVQVNSRDRTGRTALHYACLYEHKDKQRVVDVLLDAGTEVNAQDEDGQTPLHVAVLSNLYRTKPENNTAGGENEETPLAISSTRNEVLVKTLLREGVQVDSRDSWGRTALHYACRSENEDMQRVVDLLLDAGAEVNTQEEDGLTPLHVAVRRISIQTKIENNATGGENEETLLAISSTRNEVLVKTLLREGVQVDSRDSWGRTALHYACRSENEDMQRVVDVLLDADAEVNAQDEDGQTPLHVAVRRNSFQTKLEQNAAGGENEGIPLAISSKRNKVLVKTLLRKGALVNVRDRMMRTALHCACMYEHTIEAEAWDITNFQDETGQKPLHVAIVNNEIVKALLANITGERSKERSSQHLVDHSQDKEKVRMVNSQDGDGNTALHLACTRSSFTDDIMECVRLLFCAGAKVGVLNNDGMTALHMAARYSRADVVDILLINGEDVNATNKYADTPLHVASQGGRTETVRLLLSKGAKVGVKNEMGETPLHKAAAFATGDIVDVLVDQGEYVRAKDRFGNTPLHHVGANPDFGGIYYPEVAFIINFLIIRGAKIDEQNIHGETPHEQIKARRDIRTQDLKHIDGTFITHVIRLKTLRLQDKFYISWILGQDFYDNVKFRCCQELESMKSTMVVKDISLYQVLSHISQPFIVSTEDLQHIDEFLSSPDLLTRFPLYGDTLRITFQRAKLLTLAVQSFYSEQRKQMMKKLPCEVTEQLVNFLSNNDLRMFIESE